MVGLYFYDNHACEYAKQLKPSARGELEITDLNRIYLNKRKLKAQVLPINTIWADTGTFESMLLTSMTIHNVQIGEKTLIGSPEKVALEQKYIDNSQLLEWILHFKSNPYYEFLKNLCNTS